MNSKAMKWVNDEGYQTRWPLVFHGLGFQSTIRLAFWCDQPFTIARIFYRAGRLYGQLVDSHAGFYNMLRMLLSGDWQQHSLGTMAEWMGAVNRQEPELAVTAGLFQPEGEGSQPILHLNPLPPSCRMFIAPSVIPGDPGRGKGRGGSWGVMIENVLDPNQEREPFAEEAFIVQAVAPLLCMEYGGLSWPIRLLESDQVVPAGILFAQATIRLWDDRSHYAAQLWDMMNDGLYAPHMRRASRSEL